MPPSVGRGARKVECGWQEEEEEGAADMKKVTDGGGRCSNLQLRVRIRGRMGRLKIHGHFKVSFGSLREICIIFSWDVRVRAKKNRHGHTSGGSSVILEH